MRVAVEVMDRFMDKVSPEPNTGCWLWIASCTHHGYGKFYFSPTRQLSAHCASYELFVGERTKGLVIDHLCRVTCCVNPRHLEQVTQKENVRRGAVCLARLPSRGKAKGGSVKLSHCKKGHPFTPDNTYVKPSGKRACRICQINYLRQFRVRAKQIIKEHDHHAN